MIDLSLGQPTPRGRALDIRYSNRSSGSCGVFFHLFDEDAPAATRHYVDLGTYTWVTLEFNGVPNVQLRIADASLYRREDSALVGLLSGFAGSASADGWRQASIPLARAPLRTKDAAVIALAFPAGTSGTLSVAQIAFTSSRDLRPEAVSASIPSQPQSAAKHRAMWFWEFGDCLSDHALCTTVFDFAKRSHIDTIFAQVSYQCDGGSNVKTCTFDHPDRLREVLAQATNAGLKIHALDGAAEYALARYHPRMTGLARAVLDFNRNVPAESRFAGLHFDIEPYLLFGFDSSVRPSILRDYLTLCRDVMHLIQADTNRIEFGADIPFWYDEASRRGVNPYVVNFDGKTQDVSKHLIDMLDNVVLMDYRNSMMGGDGIVAHATGEIDYAAGRHAQVIIGVETLPQRADPVVFLAGLSERKWQEERTNPLLSERRFHGFGLRGFTDGTNRYLGLAPGRDLNDPAFRAALEALAAAFDVPQLNGDQRSAALNQARTGLQDYAAFAAFDLPNRAAFSVSSIPLAKISFAGHTLGEMESVLRGVQEYFAPSPAFGGVAIHSWASWSLMK